MTARMNQKFWWSLLLALSGAGQSVLAQEPVPVTDVDAQRASIEDSRRSQMQRLDARAKDCEPKFAVTRCLGQVHSERLEVEGKLKRQEMALNDAQRLERGREQKERNKEKAAVHAEKMAALGGEVTTDRNQSKRVARPTAPARQSVPAAAKEPFLSAQERSTNVNDYERKQRDVVAKRAEVANRLKDAGAKKPSLPKPD